MQCIESVGLLYACCITVLLDVELADVKTSDCGTMAIADCRP